MTDLPLTDYELERALAQEAVLDWPRFQSMGLTSAHFAHGATRGTVEAAESVAGRSGPVTLESVATALQRAGKLASLGGVDGLRHLLLAGAAPDPDRLLELWRLRALREAGMRCQVHAERCDESGAIETLSAAMDSALKDSGSSGPIDAVDLVVGLIRQLATGTRARRLVHPGLEILERAAGEFMAPSCVVIGAAPNVGKSWYCMAMLMAMARRNVSCSYFSAEDPRDLVSARVLSVISGVSSKRLALGQVDRDDMVQITEQAVPVLQSLYAKKLWFEFKLGGTELDIMTAMSAHAARGSRLVVIDYIQTLVPSKKQQDRANDIGFMLKRIKAHAYNLGLVIVVVSQFSRPPKGVKSWEPTKFDLKESGELENCAEYIILLWRDEDHDASPVRVKLEKAKLGGIGAKWEMQRNPHTAVLEEVPGSYRGPGS